MELKNTAILLGASGLAGGFCLQALLADTHYSKIRLLNRRALTIASHRRLKQSTVDFESLSLVDFYDVEDVFCALGTTIRKAGSREAFRRVDFEYPLTAAKLARQAGAKQFVLVSSVGADPKSKNLYLRTKGELEQEICNLRFDAVHIFRPSLLLGRREESRSGERLLQAIAPLLNLVMLGGLRRYRGFPAVAVGEAMVVAAREGNSGLFIYQYDEIARLAA
jgi:uncharacterized protein YbjT (DUF2867 family)